jgi:CDP-diacylglycerol--glycerol-3-phosphate 3-phosphatidyltransferase
MPSIYDLKPRFQRLLRPVTRRLVGAGATANQVTVAAFGLSLLVGALIALSGGAPRILLSVPVMMLGRMALNAIDGMLAREHDMKSPQGAILNDLCDVGSDAALYLPFALIPGVEPWQAVGIVVLSGLGEMAGVVAVQIGASRRYDGPMGKSDRAFVFGSVSLALGLGVPTGLWLDIVMGAVLVLLAVTIRNRVRRAIAEVS